MKSLAYIGKDGDIHIDTDLITEQQVWNVFLGWPTPEEIEQAKLRGAKVVEVEIIVKEDEE